LASGSTDRGAAVVGVVGDTFGNFYYAARYGDRPSEIVTVAVPQVCADWINMPKTEQDSLLGAGALLACRERLVAMDMQGTLMTLPGEAG
jgi:hypothetical protein